jgi:hypothetical protein
MQNQESIVRTKEKNKVKYVCKLCDYITFRKSNIERHFKTIKHKEQKGAKKEQKRSKKEQKGATENEYCCSVCNYQTIYKANLQRHIENLSHHEKVIKSDKKVIKNDKQNQEKNQYFCELCNYKTKRSNNFERHCSGKPHQEKVSTSEQQVSTSEQQVSTSKESEIDETNSIITDNYKLYQCEFCKKEYKFSSGLSKHKKKCKSLELQQNIDTKLSYLTNENENIKSKLDELANKPYTINNNTINNNTLNIETFLNTECSGAMDFLDFIRSLTITTDDIKRMSKTGFIKSYGELVTQKIKDMDIKDRPAHCTNKRQMFFFLKHNDIWTDDKDFTLFNQSINILKDKECEAWYNYSLEEREKNYESDADVNIRANAINEIAKMNDETLFTKIIKKASTELYLSKQDI